MSDCSHNGILGLQYLLKIRPTISRISPTFQLITDLIKKHSGPLFKAYHDKYYPIVVDSATTEEPIS